MSGLYACFAPDGFAHAADIDTLLGHYEHLHRQPELSLQERDTAAYLAAQLEAADYEVSTDIGGYGLVGEIKNGEGPTLLFRADMDALPIEEKTGLPYRSSVRATNRSGEEVPVMHACGHDIHMTDLLGIAREMAANRDAWQGTLLLVAQPAEEIGADARPTIETGVKAMSAVILELFRKENKPVPSPPS